MNRHEERIVMSDTKIELNGKIARTAPSRSHLNRIILNGCGVTELRLTAGDKRSVSYLPDGSKDKDAKKTGADTFNFAPGRDKDGKAVDPVEIVYRLLDPRGAITKATLELVRPKSETPLWTLDLNPAELKGVLLTSGPHHLQWDGGFANKIVKTAGGDGKDVFTLKWEDSDPAKTCPYVSLAFANYKLRLKIEGTGQADPAQAHTYFHILAHSIELERGPKDAAPLARDKEVWDSLDAGEIAAGNDTKIFLKSNVFKTASAEMETNAGYEQYRAAWGQPPTGAPASVDGNGPNIPLFAKVWVQNAKGEKTDAPHALRDAKFLWDWETPADQNLSGLDARKQVFVGDALNYLKTQTKPKRDNCHADRGGKRGADSTGALAKTVFPASAGYAPQTPLKTDGSFPFKVAPYDAAKTDKKRDNLLVRKWAALSEGWAGWKNPDLAGKTGVLFQPSRMAGDRYKVTVYLCCETKDFDDKDDTVTLDTDADAPLVVNDKIKKASGVFTVWRDVRIVKYWKKTSALPITSISVATVINRYADAFIRLQDDSGGIEYMDSGVYNTAVQNAATAAGGGYELMLDSTIDQHGGGRRFLYFRDYNGWRTAMKADQGWSNAELNAWLATPNGTPWADANRYNATAKNFAMWMYPRVVAGFMGANEGINIFQFLNTHNLPGGTSLNGFAVEMPAPERNKCGFIQCGDNYGGTTSVGGVDVPNLNTREQTTTHEIGHHLFLPHTWQVDISHDPQKSHDKGDTACTMSYEFDKDRKFCGFCLLRLRGWSKFLTDADGAPDAATRTLVETSASNKKLNP